MGRLYNTHRPQFFYDIIGNNDVDILKGIIDRQSYKFKREYLLYSDHIGGVGKTTAALIFAKAVNCIDTKEGNPCNECDNCRSFDEGQYHDFININGSDYNQVDKVKPIVELAKQYPINPEGYKIIVIDEFQRMSPQAMSEFLHLFEFGNNRTIFLLTTTNKKSVIQPILSRVMPIEFRPPSVLDIHTELERVVEKDNITYSDYNLQRISTQANGSVRDALSILEKYTLSYGTIDDTVDVSNEIDLFVKDIARAVYKGTTKIEQSLYSYSPNTLDRFSSIIFQLLNYADLEHTIITKEVHKLVRPILTRSVLMDMAKMYLRHKPKTTSEFVLFLSIFEHETMGKEFEDYSDEEASMEDEEVVIEDTIFDIMKKQGFEMGARTGTEHKAVDHG